MQTRSQQYSEVVFKQINELELSEKEVKTYGSLCHNFPLMVLRSGLSQAVAFVLVKAKLPDKQKNKHSQPHLSFLENLADLTALELNTGEKAQQFQQKIVALDLIEYQRITRKILAASIWYKRFAESWLGISQGDDEQDGSKS